MTVGFWNIRVCGTKNALVEVKILCLVSYVESLPDRGVHKYLFRDPIDHFNFF